MAYSPVGQGGALLRHSTLVAIAAQHVRANAAASSIVLTPQDLAEIDAAFPPPKRAMPLAML